MPQPPKPIVPPPALRTDIATFPPRAEASINFWPVLVTYIDESATWISIKSDEVTAMAALAGIPDLTGFGGRIPIVKEDGSAFEFAVTGRLEAIEAGAPVELAGPVTFGGPVTITSGQISGISDLSIADGGTGASTAAAARNNLDVFARGEVYPRASLYTRAEADTAFRPSGLALGGYVANTLYQNTTGKMMFTGMSVSVAGTTGNIRLRVGPDAGVAIVMFQTNLPNNGQTLGGFGACPPGWFFFWEATSISSSGGAVFY